MKTVRLQSREAPREAAPPQRNVYYAQQPVPSQQFRQPVADDDLMKAYDMIAECDKRQVLGNHRIYLPESEQSATSLFPSS